MYPCAVARLSSGVPLRSLQGGLRRSTPLGCLWCTCGVPLCCFPEWVREALSGKSGSPVPKVIVVTNPDNPTGTFVPKEDLLVSAPGLSPPPKHVRKGQYPLPHTPLKARRRRLVTPSLCSRAPRRCRMRTGLFLAPRTPSELVTAGRAFLSFGAVLTLSGDLAPLRSSRELAHP